jgi:integrase
VLSRGEQKRLEENIYANPDLCNCGILLCLYTGLRIGELCALKWENISLPDKVIHVTKTMQRTQKLTDREKIRTEVIITEPKSACSNRKIPIPKNIVRVLTPLQASPDAFFLSGRSDRYVEPRTMQNRFRHVLSQSNIDVMNFHVLRHTFATRCVELGFDIKSLSEILGHANVNITLNRYVHPSMELKEKNMDMLSELFAVK